MMLVNLTRCAFACLQVGDKSLQDWASCQHHEDLPCLEDTLCSMDIQAGTSIALEAFVAFDRVNSTQAMVAAGRLDTNILVMEQDSRIAVRSAVPKMTLLALRTLVVCRLQAIGFSIFSFAFQKQLGIQAGVFALAQDFIFGYCIFVLLGRYFAIHFAELMLAYQNLTIGTCHRGINPNQHENVYLAFRYDDLQHQKECQLLTKFLILDLYQTYFLMQIKRQIAPSPE